MTLYSKINLSQERNEYKQKKKQQQPITNKTKTKKHINPPLAIQEKCLAMEM